MSVSFSQNLELDAACVCAAYSGGLHAMLGVALFAGCPSPEEAISRAEWLKEQPATYIDQVVARVAALQDGAKHERSPGWMATA